MYQTTAFDDFAPTLGELAEMGYPLFDDSWNTYVPEYKAALCEKIKRYFWFNQIGAETPDRFRHFLNAELERKMPFYNQMYASQLIEFDPMVNYVIKTQSRKIENLAKLASTDTSNIGKSLRNFVNSGNRDEVGDGSLKGKYGKTIDRDIVENATKDIDETESKRGTEDITDAKTTSGNNSGKESGSSDEKRDTVTASTELYSDTPQKSVNQDSVVWSYLTNARKINGTENVTDTITNSREYSNEETGKEDGTRDRNWTETDEITRNEKGKTTTTDGTEESSTTGEDTTHKVNEKTNSNGREDNMTSNAGNTTTDEKHTIDEGKNEDTSGIMNVSPSDLLRAFRDTFVNVDEMILNDLRGLFMEVF